MAARHSRDRDRARVPGAQAGYCSLTGVWPVAHRRSFERVTGPKREFWLVNTVGGLLTTVGMAIALALSRRRITPEIELLAGASAAVLAAVDVVYAARRRISGTEVASLRSGRGPPRRATIP